MRQTTMAHPVPAAAPPSPRFMRAVSSRHMHLTYGEEEKGIGISCIIERRPQTFAASRNILAVLPLSHHPETCGFAAANIA
ncbi:unnamed protein product [Leptosia nina]|uniref:Uncharacterized protein n=1 Tax=Leptosia nina TaxID=320188 RepID=A0AAV1JTC8_9NEOP